MDRLLKVLDLFRKGNAVADPALWRTHQVNANMLAAALLALVETLRAFGVDVHISEVQTYALAGGLLALVNVVLTTVSSSDVGVRARAPANDAAGNSSSNPVDPGGA